MAAPGETRIGFMGLSCLLISSVLTTSLTSGVIRDLAQSWLVLAGCYGEPALHQNTVWRRGPDPASIWSKLWWFFSVCLESLFCWRPAAEQLFVCSLHNLRACTRRSNTQPSSVGLVLRKLKPTVWVCLSSTYTVYTESTMWWASN